VSRLVVKVGGAVAEGAAAHLLGLVAEGNEICVVHGAGPQISAELSRRGIPVEFIAGRRVTSPEAIAVVRQALVEVNAGLCAALGDAAVGLIGDEIGLQAMPVPELGLVGDAVPSCPDAIEDALAAGFIPVVAPLAEGPLNVNADEMAAALAVGLDVDRICFLTDVPGLLLDGTVVGQIEADDAEELLAGGLLDGGILPKLRAAVTAARFGVRAEIGETEILGGPRISRKAVGTS
jgi:acetylglutamate kinase